MTRLIMSHIIEWMYYCPKENRVLVAYTKMGMAVRQLIESGTVAVYLNKLFWSWNMLYLGLNKHLLFSAATFSPIIHRETGLELKSRLLFSGKLSAALVVVWLLHTMSHLIVCKGKMMGREGSVTKVNGFIYEGPELHRRLIRKDPRN